VVFNNGAIDNGAIDNSLTWTTSSALKSLSECFFACANFNCNVNSLNVSSVTSMLSCFYGCIRFNQSLSSWNTSNVTNMSYMFFNAKTFNQNIAYNVNYWNTLNVATIASIFACDKSQGSGVFNNANAPMNWILTGLTGGPPTTEMVNTLSNSSVYNWRGGFANTDASLLSPGNAPAALKNALGEFL
jgi:surface protein